MPATIHLSENWADLLDARVRKVFDSEFEENIKESMIGYLLAEESTSRNYEIMSGMGGGSDVGEFDGSLDYDSIEQLWDKATYFNERAKGMKIQRKLADDDLFGKMDSRPRTMAVDTARTREKMAAAVWNNAFTGSSGPDSKALCATDHPYSPTNSTTQGNKGTSSLNAVNIEATRRIGHTSIFQANGELASINYDTILCTVYNEEKAWEIINSRGKVDTDTNNRNFHEGRYKLAVWDRLTSSYNWFMIDLRLWKIFAKWWKRVPVEFNYDRDFDTYIAKWSVYFREYPDWYDWKPVYGHQATS